MIVIKKYTEVFGNNGYNLHLGEKLCKVKFILGFYE